MGNTITLYQYIESDAIYCGNKKGKPQQIVFKGKCTHENTGN